MLENGPGAADGLASSSRDSSAGTILDAGAVAVAVALIAAIP